MGFLSFLSRKMASHGTSKHGDKDKNLTSNLKQTDSVTSTHSNETSSVNTRKRHSKNKSFKLKVKCTDTDSVTSMDTPPSLNISNKKIVENYVAAKNRHASIEELLQFWSSDNARVKFDDHGNMTVMQMMLEVHNLFEGFHDLQFDYESIKEGRPGQVYVEGLVVSGTHTADLKFADFPIIPKTDKHVVCDEERLLYTVKDGKITQMVVLGLGGLTGPPGFYVAVGGNLEKPSET